MNLGVDVSLVVVGGYTTAKIPPKFLAKKKLKKKNVIKMYAILD